MNRPYGIAIDAMGNIWVTNEGNDSVTMFVGAAQRTM
jgi:DNA-binding beta-propeller fold protein YncE